MRIGLVKFAVLLERRPSAAGAEAAQRVANSFGGTYPSELYGRG